MLLSDWFHERRLSVSGSTSNLRCLGRAITPQTLHSPKVKTSKYTWYSFLPKNLWEQLHKLGLSSEKKAAIFFFFASSLRLFFFFQRYMIYAFLRNGLCFLVCQNFSGTIWTGKTCWSKPLLVFIFSVFGLDLHFSEEMSISCSFLWWCTWVRPHPCTLAPFELSPLWAFWTLISNMGAVHHDLFG